MAPLLGGAPAQPAADEPGVLVLTDDGSIAATTPATQRWLEEVAPEDWPPAAGLPRAVRTVAACARALDGVGPVEPALMLRARLRLVTGTAPSAGR
jgi:hypothetical protein